MDLFAFLFHNWLYFDFSRVRLSSRILTQNTQNIYSEYCVYHITYKFFPAKFFNGYDDQDFLDLMKGRVDMKNNFESYPFHVARVSCDPIVASNILLPIEPFWPGWYQLTFWIMIIYLPSKCLSDWGVPNAGFPWYVSSFSCAFKNLYLFLVKNRDRYMIPS